MKKTRNYKAESIREFNRSADDYDHHSPFYYRMARLCDDAVLKQLAPLQNSSARILDVGCGTGVLLEKLRQSIPDAMLHGIDISNNMLDIARKRNIANAELIEGDSENLPYQDAFFDIVICCSSFHHYPNPEKAVSDFRRVTRPGGKLIICDMDLPGIARLFANCILFPMQHKGDVHVYTRHEIKTLLRKHGWTCCNVSRITPVEWMAIGKAPVLPHTA